MGRLPVLVPRNPDLGLLLMRVAMGAILLSHSLTMFSVGPLDGAPRLFAGLGIPLPELVAPFITVLELVGGLAVLFGVLTRVFGALFVVQFVVAMTARLTHQGWIPANLDIMMLAAAVLLFLTGAGLYSVDAWARRRSGALGHEAVRAPAAA